MFPASVLSAAVPSPPTATSPGSGSAPGASVSTATPTFQWTAISGATKYGLYISKSPYGSANLVYTNANISGTSFTIPTALTNGTSYRWQVTAFNVGGESNGSNLLYFTVSTSTPVPTPPTAQSPGTGSAPGSSITTSTPTFQWSSVSGATKYGLYISQSPYGSANLVYTNTNVGGTSFTIPTGLTNGTSYRWQVTAFNAGGESNGSNLLYFTVSTSVPVPAPPTALSPGSGSAPGSNVTTSTPAFQWTSVSGATRYGLYISQSPYGPSNLVYSNTNINGTSFTIPSALANGVSYRWQVTAFNGSGESHGSNLLYFTVSTSVPSPPNATSPGTNSAPGSNLSSTTPTFQWTSVSGAAKYGLYVSQSPYGPSNLVYSNTNINGTSFTILSALTNGVSYRWQVTAFNSAGESNASNLLYFTVGSDPVPTPPTAQSPGSASAPGSTVSTGTPTFQWTAVGGATKYALYISQSPYGSSNLVYSNMNVSGTTFTLPTALPVGQYRWQVTAWNGSGESGGSNLLYFTISGSTPPPAPTAQSPGSGSAPGSNVSTTTPTFQWTAVTGATKYGFYISQSPYGPSNLVYSNTNVSGTTFTIPTALTNDVAYRWQVTAFSVAGESSGSNFLYFMPVLGLPPLPPTASSPGSNSAPGPSVTTTTPTFQWTAVNGATKYGFYISQSPYGPSNVVYSNTNVGSTSFTIPTALTNGVSYRWQVTAFNGFGESNASNLLYFTVSTGGGAPSAPTASSPGGGSAPGPNVGTTTPTFQWTLVSGATRYGLYVSQSPYGPSNLVYSNTNVNGTAFTIPTALTNGTSYRWQVTAFNAAGAESSASNLLHFTISTGGTVPSAPTASSPGSGSAPGPSVNTTTPTFQWTSVNSATRYGLYISQAPYGSTNLVYSNTSVSGTSFTIPTPLTNGISYRWQVTAFNATGVEGSPSNLLYFTVSTSAAVHPDLVPSGIALSRTSLTAGESITVTVTVANRGNALAAATTTRIRINTSPSSSDPSDAVQRAIATPPIAAGDSAEVNSSFTLTEPGIYYAHAYVDYGVVLEQSNRSNDAAHHGPVTVKSATASNGPDLLARDVKASPTFGAPGASVRMTFSVANDGNDLAAPSTAEIRLAVSSSSVADSDPLLDRINVPSLTAGAAHAVDRTVTIPAGTSGGTKYVWVSVDADRGAGQRAELRSNDRTRIAFVVNPDNPNAPTAQLIADPETIDLGQTATLRWTTTAATTVSIDNELGERPVNSSVEVKPIRTTTYTLTAVGPGGSTTAQATVTLRNALTEVTVGGLRFTADSVTRVQGGYRLTGAVSIQGVIAYNGTMSLRDADAAGRYTMEGAGTLRLPRVTMPGGGTLVLFDGTFSLKFSDGELVDGLEKYSRFAIAGWKVEVDKVALLSDGVRIMGSLRIPQYGSVSATSISTTIDATHARGVEISGRLLISRIGLAGGFWLERVDIGYDRTTNTFYGTGTLRTTALGITVALKVVDGCPNSGHLTISKVPIVLGGTGLQLVNYGADATGLCSVSPFGIGLHTDLTFVKNPNPDLLSFSDVNAMYFPPTSLKGGGTARLLYTDIANAKVFFNYADDTVDCDNGFCFHAVIGLPSSDLAWIRGELEGRVMLSPFRVHGSPRLTVQIPKSCADMKLGFWQGGFICSLASCKQYPCVLGEMTGSVSIDPSGDPAATLGGQVWVRGKFPVSVYVTFSEGGDRRFHLHLFRNTSAGGDEVRTSNVGDVAVAIPSRTEYAYIALSATSLSDVTLTSPSGRRYSRTGQSGVDYFEDVATKMAVYALQSPEPGVWTVSGATDVMSSLPPGASTVLIRAASTVGRDVRIDWQTANAPVGSDVSLTYASSVGGSDLGVIADVAATNNATSTLWNTTAIPSGTYYVRARMVNVGGPGAMYTLAEPVEIVGDLAPVAPRNLRGTVLESNVRLMWDAAEMNVDGYIVVQRTGVQPFVNERTIGNVLSYDLSNLDRSTGYTFQVLAYDEEGRRSAASNPFRVSWSPCELSVVGVVPGIVSMTDVASFSAVASARGGCTDSIEYRWDLGDTNTSSGQAFGHRYAAPGVYGWTLQAMASGRIAVATGVVRVQTGRCTIEVDQPAADAVIDTGSPTPIVWSTSGPCSGDVRIDLVRDVTDERPIARAVKGTSLIWTPSGLRSGRYYIRVADEANPAYSAVSQEFTINSNTRRRTSRP